MAEAFSSTRQLSWITRGQESALNPRSLSNFQEKGIRWRRGGAGEEGIESRKGGGFPGRASEVIGIV